MKPQPIFFANVKLWLHSDVCVWDPEDIKCIRLEAIWNFSKVTGLPWIDVGHKGPVN
jgi:hypothetical protein